MTHPLALALSDKDRTFAEEYVKSRNIGLAYRRAYEPPSFMSGSEIHAKAKRVLDKPRVKEYVDWLTSQAISMTSMSAHELVQDLIDIVSADPNELISHVRHGCRHCNGPNFEYQWKNEQEYIDACRVAELAEIQLPSFDGGFEYNPSAPVNPDCPHCGGRGEGEVFVADTTKLSRQAQLLYKGVKITKNGIEVLMVDQYAARRDLMMMIGLLRAEGYKPPGDPNKAAKEAARLNEIEDPTELSRAMQDFINNRPITLQVAKGES